MKMKQAAAGATVEPDDTPAADCRDVKRPRTSTLLTTLTRILDIDCVLQNILLCIDIDSVEAFLTVLNSPTRRWQRFLQQDLLWHEMLQCHFHGHCPPANGEDALDIPISFKPEYIALWELACPNLREFLLSMHDQQQFNDRIHIVRGDIGEISMLNDQPIDGIAFPTSSVLWNPRIGAAACVFRRAGLELDDHIAELQVHLRTGEVYVTPGFASGVQKLIHCVGPSGNHELCLQQLARTYTTLLESVENEDLACVALASISTGNMGIPAVAAAEVALVEIQRFLRTHRGWIGSLGFVCYEADVYTAFANRKHEILTAFNAEKYDGAA